MKLTHPMVNKRNPLRSGIVKDYYPEVVKGLLPEVLEGSAKHSICLFGFCDNLKWMSRILMELDVEYSLHDWRSEYIGYDTCEHVVDQWETIADKIEPLIVICDDTLLTIYEHTLFLVESSLKNIPTLYEFVDPYKPLEQSDVYANIVSSSRKRVSSINSDARQFNLMQVIRQISTVPGEIVEFGSYEGGSGSLIWECLNYWDIDKKLTLFESFKGFPSSPLGVDMRWGGSFSNISEAEARARFKGLRNVELIQGEIVENLHFVDTQLAFVHVDVDTYYAVKNIMARVWPLVSTNGVVLFDDYGFFPNCIPLTAFVDEFVNTHPAAFCFYLPSNGFMVIKHSQDN